eukprot:2663848-Rhodomonas_salina.3
MRGWDIYAAEMFRKVLDESKNTKKIAVLSFQVPDFKTSNEHLDVQLENTRVKILLGRMSAPMIWNDSSVQFDL